MVKTYSILILSFIIVSAFSCKKKVDYQSLSGQTNGCELSIEKSGVLVEWSAYKFTKKVAVKGKFDKIEFSKLKTQATIAQSLSGIDFEIPVSSLNSGDNGRDEKIKKYFFGSMSKTETLAGRLIEVNDDASAKVKLKLNEVEVTLPAKIQLSKDTKTLQLGLSLDMADFKAQKSVESLNKACAELHTGDDKVSKLWPNVDVTVTAKLSSQCP